MTMRETKTVNICDSVGDLTFVLGEDQYVGLGRVRFVITKYLVDGVDMLNDSCEGKFYPKDDEIAFKLLAPAHLEGKHLEIRGSFRDTINDDKEADWKLDNVLFDRVKEAGYGHSGRFIQNIHLGTFMG